MRGCHRGMGRMDSEWIRATADFHLCIRRLASCVLIVADGSSASRRRSDYRPRVDDRALTEAMMGCAQTTHACTGPLAVLRDMLRRRACVVACACGVVRMMSRSCDGEITLCRSSTACVRARIRSFCTMSHCVMCCVPCVRRRNHGGDDETVIPHSDHSLSMVPVCASVKPPRVVLCCVCL
jgi:hypothetical protein